jgi:hypothetical protein
MAVTALPGGPSAGQVWPRGPSGAVGQTVVARA